MAKLNYNLNDIPDAPTIPKGRYKVRLVSVVKQASKSSGNPMLVWLWKITSKGKQKGIKMKSWTTLMPNALSGLKMHLLALGKKGKVKGTTDKLIGLYCVAVVGKRMGVNQMGEKAEFSSILGLLPKGTALSTDDDVGDKDIDDDDDEEEDDDVDDDDNDEDDDDEEEEDNEDLSEMSLSDLKTFAKQNDIKLTKKQKAKRKLARKAIEAAIEEDNAEEDDDDDEDEEEEEEAPKKSKKSKSKKSGAAALKEKAAAKRRKSVDDDEGDGDEDDEDDDDDDDDDDKVPF